MDPCVARRAFSPSPCSHPVILFILSVLFQLLLAVGTTGWSVRGPFPCSTGLVAAAPACRSRSESAHVRVIRVRPWLSRSVPVAIPHCVRNDHPLGTTTSDAEVFLTTGERALVMEKPALSIEAAAEAGE